MKKKQNVVLNEKQFTNLITKMVKESVKRVTIFEKIRNKSILNECGGSGCGYNGGYGSCGGIYTNSCGGGCGGRHYWGGSSCGFGIVRGGC